MSKLKSKLGIVLASCLLLTGCKAETEEEKFLDAVREQGDRYSFLSPCDTAIYSLEQMFGMWSPTTYQLAKSSAKLGAALMNEWFPSANWLGNPLTNQELNADIKEICYSSVENNVVTGYFIVEVENKVFVEYKSSLYSFKYSYPDDAIIGLDLIDSY